MQEEPSGPNEPHHADETSLTLTLDDPLLRHSWQRCWGSLTDGSDGEPVRQALLQAYAQPQRHYHSLQHLRECLELLQAHHDLAHHPAEVELAMWFHDAIYEPRASDNEECSAQWAQDALQRAAAVPEAIARVAQCVLATRHDAMPQQRDEQLVVDIDLAILAAPRSRFDEYQAQVRAEYAWVPDSIYRHKRREVLARFLAREVIYSTPRLRAQFEQPARENLARALQQLTA